MRKIKKLPRKFFAGNSLDVAQALIGKVMVYHGQKAMITETEAYHGFDDPASHAAKGKTPRSAIMFGPPGYAYVYLTYGMYHCLNIVTECIDYPAAVLIRGVKLLAEPKTHYNGPGKLCKYLNITRQDNNHDVIKSKEFYFECHQIELNYQAGPRIGIKVGLDKLWRYTAILD